MDWIKKNRLIATLFTSTLCVLFLLSLGLFQFAFHTIPEKLHDQSHLMCTQQLETKSYQLKQFILENINNSKVWVENRKDFFYDTRWFAISFYEHDGREWLLKDFKMNSVVLDVYKVAPSDYIKMEQAFVTPHPQSEQINIQYGIIQNLPLVVIDATNPIRKNHKNHMIRISLFSDLMTSVINSDSLCTFNLLTTRGNFVFENKQIDKKDFLSKIQANFFSTENPIELQTFELDNYQVITKKLLKNLYVFSLVTPTDNLFHGAFIQFLVINGVSALVILFLLFKFIRNRFKNRIQYLETNISQLSSKKPQISFDFTKTDELSVLDERISQVNEDLKKRS